MARTAAPERSWDDSRLDGWVAWVRCRCNFPNSWELWITTAPHLAEPRPCGHWKASPVSPPVRVLLPCAPEKGDTGALGRPQLGPFPAGARASRRRKTPEGRLHPGWSRLPRLGGCGREAMRSGSPRWDPGLVPCEPAGRDGDGEAESW
ncbi:hypothetical protein MRX96_009564 [Rhipicephalus microplus]